MTTGDADTGTQSDALAPPRFAQIEPVGQCNLRCTMCSIQYRRDGPPYGPLAFMPYDAFTALVDELRDVTELHLQGLGEPLMHPRFFDMVAYAAARSIAVGVNTNLTLLSRERAVRCVTSGLQGLHVSIDGATARTYEAIRVNASFERLLRNIGRLVDEKKRLAAALPHLGFTIVAMRRNLHELAALVRLAARFEIASVSVQHLAHDFAESTLPSHYTAMRDYVRAQTLADEEPARVEAAFAEARATAETLGVALRLPRIEPRAERVATRRGRERCDLPWRGTYVSYDGRAMPCCMVATPDRAEFGRVTESGFAAVWNGEAATTFRARLESDEPPEICRTCAVYNGTF